MGREKTLGLTNDNYPLNMVYVEFYKGEGPHYRKPILEI